MTDRETAELWGSHPIVGHAIEATGGDPLLCMEKMLETMNDLEALFPGLPFAEILKPRRRYDKGQICKLLIEQGYDELEAKELAGHNAVRY